MDLMKKIMTKKEVLTKYIIAGYSTGAFTGIFMVSTAEIMLRSFRQGNTFVGILGIIGIILISVLQIRALSWLIGLARACMNDLWCYISVARGKEVTLDEILELKGGKKDDSDRLAKTTD